MSSLEQDRRRAGSLLLGLAILAYLLLSTVQITLPGIYYDEALHAPAAVALVSGNGDQIGIGVGTGRWRLPVMAGEYVGSLRSYVLVPLFVVFGPGVVTYRLTMILIAAVGIFFGARFAKEAFGWVPAIVGAWLIATDPTFILATRADWGPVALAFTLRTTSLYLGWRWWRSRGEAKASLFVMSVLLGLGVWDKANFLWFVVALAVVTAIAWLLSSERPRIGWRAGAVALSGFLLGVAPLLAFNLERSWITFRLIVAPGEKTSLLHLATLVGGRTRDLIVTFDAGAIAHWMSGIRLYPADSLSRSLLLPFSLTAIVVLLVLALRRRRPFFAFLPVLMLAMLAQMYATPRHIWIHHYLSIYPLPHLAIGAVVGLFFARDSGNVRRRKRAIASTALVLVAVTFNLVTMTRFHRNLAERGGSVAWSDAIYPLARTLAADFGDRQIQVMDWGIFNQMYLLTGGKLKLFEPIYSLAESVGADQRVLELVSDSRNVFVLHSAQATNMKNPALALEAAARLLGVTVRREQL
ncbi:MAG: YtxH domain-containing protein, partial [Acidobacteriota bacterium]